MHHYYACAVCVVRVGVCSCVRVCAFVCWNPTFQLLYLLSLPAATVTYYVVCITPSLQLSSSLLCDSPRTTAVAHQALPFVTATDGASACACVHVLCFLRGRTRNLKRGARMLRREQGNPNPHLPPRDLNQPRSYGYNNSSRAATV